MMRPRTGEFAALIQPRPSSVCRLVCSEFSYYMEGIAQIECCAHLADTMNDVMNIRI
jgi:hypothetical protein